MPRSPISKPCRLATLALGVLVFGLAGCLEEEGRDAAAAAGPLAPPAETSGPAARRAARPAERRAALEAALDAARATPEQRAKIDALIAEARASGRRPAGLRCAIGEVLTPEQRQAMRESLRARHGGPGPFMRARGERLARRLDLGDCQRRDIQRLIADFRGKHEGEIAALRAAAERLGDDWVAGCWREDRPEGGLRQELGDALRAAGHDPEAFRRDLLELGAAVRKVFTPEQAAKLEAHRLRLLRRLLEG